MKIETPEFDSTARWTTKSPLFLRAGRWTTDNGVDSGGQIVPGALVERPPSADRPSLKISWPEMTVQLLLERINGSIKEAPKCICETTLNGDIVRAIDCPKFHGTY